jgi:hypothetical protein
MKDTKHIWRVFLLILLGIIVFAVGRILLVPKTFGLFGHFRASDVMEQRALEVKHQGPASCEPCHSDEHELWKMNSHKNIICEDCHAPYVTHVKNDEKYAEMEINRSYNFCLRCHQQLPARPADFPQIQVIEHLAQFQAALQDTVCFRCHSAHDPAAKDPEKNKEALHAKKE